MTAAVSEDADGRTFLPSDEPAKVIDFIAHLQARGRKAAPARARLVDVDGKSVELPESMLEVLVQVAESMKAGLAVTVRPTT